MKTLTIIIFLTFLGLFGCLEDATTPNGDTTEPTETTDDTIAPTTANLDEIDSTIKVLAANVFFDSATLPAAIPGITDAEGLMKYVSDSSGLIDLQSVVVAIARQAVREILAEEIKFRNDSSKIKVDTVQEVLDVTTMDVTKILEGTWSFDNIFKGTQCEDAPDLGEITFNEDTWNTNGIWWAGRNNCTDDNMEPDGAYEIINGGEFMKTTSGFIWEGAYYGVDLLLSIKVISNNEIQLQDTNSGRVSVLTKVEEETE